MTVRFKVLIYPKTVLNEDEIRFSKKIYRTSIVFTTDELQHFEKYGYILRSYSKNSSDYWFFSEIEYHDGVIKTNFIP